VLRGPLLYKGMGRTLRPKQRREWEAKKERRIDATLRLSGIMRSDEATKSHSLEPTGKVKALTGPETFCTVCKPGCQPTGAQLCKANSPSSVESSHPN